MLLAPPTHTHTLEGRTPLWTIPMELPYGTSLWTIGSPRGWQQHCHDRPPRLPKPFECETLFGGHRLRLRHRPSNRGKEVSPTASGHVW